MGLNFARSSIRFLVSGVKAVVTGQEAATTTSRRANTCAIGRNISIREPGGSTCSPSRFSALRVVSTKFAWVSSAPLGRPVVPEV